MTRRPAGENSARVATDVRVRVASYAIFTSFLLSGLNFASWAARLPAVRDELALQPGQIGLLLLVGAIASIAALPLSGVVVERLGATWTIRVAAALNTGGLVLAGLGVAVGSVVVTGAGLVVYGVGTGVWDAAMNVEGAAVERALGRSLMPRLHAGFSLGTMAGAGLGALAAWWGVDVGVHLAVLLGLSLVLVLWSSRYFLPAGTHDDDAPDAAGSAGARALGAWGERRTLLIGLVVLAAALTEGAANDWVGLAVVDGFGVGDEVGAIGFAVFVTAMTAMRLLGTGLIDRFGRVAVLRGSAVLALVGLLLFGLVDHLVGAFVGVSLWGLGAALGFPVGMSAASDDPVRAPARVAVVSTVGYSAFFVGPPLLGLLAEHVGYRAALLAIAGPVVVAIALAGAAAPLRAASGRTEVTTPSAP